MLVPTLIASPVGGAGSLLQQRLEETGVCLPVLVSSQEEARERLAEATFQLVVLEFGLPKNVLLQGSLSGESLVEFAKDLAAEYAGLHLVFLGDQNEALDVMISVADPCTFVHKPVDISNLVEQLNGIAREIAQASQAESEPPVSNAPDLPWLQDVTRAAQHLTRLSLEAAAQAALITREGRLWAYAGQLPQPGAQELAQVVIQDWEYGSGQRSDLARFVRLEATGGEYMLYATRLGEDMVLALAFDAETPFSRIRSQASGLARALASPPRPEGYTLDSSAPPAPHPPRTGDAFPRVHGPDNGGFTRQRIPTLLPPDIVPPPTPGGTHKPHTEQAVINNGFDDVDRPPIDARNRLMDAPPSELEADYDYTQGNESLQSTLVDPMPAQTRVEEYSKSLEPLPDYSELEEVDDETVGDAQANEPEPPVFPLALEELAQNLELKPVASTLYSLNYACVLIPRMPQHHLTGALPARLAEWMQQLSVAFAWTLEYLAVRPDYLLWISNVPPNTSPGYLAKMMRRHTSQRIFYEFPNLKQENPSGDFWAPGYLVISTSQPPPAQVLKDFVEHTRRQGTSGGRGSSLK